MWPPQMWMKYEHFIRKAAGFGTAPTAPDPDRYDKINAHCDVLDSLIMASSRTCRFKGGHFLLYTSYRQSLFVSHRQRRWFTLV